MTSPVISYLSSDFASHQRDLTDFAQATFADRWTNFSSPGMASMLRDFIAYQSDKQDYAMNARILETCSESAVLLRSQRDIAAMLAVDVPEAQSATVTEQLFLDSAGTYPFTITPDSMIVSNGGTDEVFFHPAGTTNVAAFSTTIDVEFVEGERYATALLGVSDGTRSQRFEFAPNSVLLSTLSLTVAGETWTRVTNFASSKSTDLHFKTTRAQTGEWFAVFGDGVFGKIPASTAEIRATFRAGGGKRGQLAQNTIKTIVKANAAVLAVTNPAAATGGLDEPGVVELRRIIPAAQRTRDRIVTLEDYADAALLVTGVAKARARTLDSRTTEVTAAGPGGSALTGATKNALVTALRAKMMAGRRVRVTDPVFRDTRLSLLLHVNTGANARSVEAAARALLINDRGTGLLDFLQVDFEGISSGRLSYAATGLQKRLALIEGLERAETLRMDAVPYVEASGIGNGTLTNQVLNGLQRRREFLVRLVSPTSAQVFERILGTVSAVDVDSIEDRSKDFLAEEPSFAGWSLQPDESSTALASVLSVTSDRVFLDPRVPAYYLSSPGAVYALQGPPVLIAVGATFTTDDGSVSFQLTNGSTPFSRGDELKLQVFPLVGDLRLGRYDYPRLTQINLGTKTVGGLVL